MAYRFVPVLGSEKGEETTGAGAQNLAPDRAMPSGGLVPVVDVGGGTPIRHVALEHPGLMQNLAKRIQIIVPDLVQELIGISRRFINTIGLAATGLFSAAGAALAQDVQVSRTSDYTLTWSGSAFSGASALYAGSTVWSGTFTDAPWTFQVLSNATDLMFNEGNGITITSPSPLTPTPPYPATIPVTFDGDGTIGQYWGWTENSAATSSGPVLTYGKLGSLETLTVTAGGAETLPDQTTPIDYYANVFLPGDWTTEGTSTGDYDGLSWNPLFSTPTFTYDSGTNTTTVSTVDFDFIPSVGGGADLTFTLIGSAIPEPSTWAMMLLGFTGLGFASLRSARKLTEAVVAVRGPAT